MAKAKQVKEAKLTYAVRAPRTSSARQVKQRNGVKRSATTKRVLGKYIVADPEICHGRVTFIGTRIFVSDVIEMVGEEMSWDEIIGQCHDSINREAIAEAVGLAAKAFRQFIDKTEGKPAVL